MRRVTVYALVLFLLLAGLTRVGVARGESEVVLGVELELVPSALELNVSPGGSGTAQADLVLHNDGSCEQTISLDLDRDQLALGLPPELTVEPYSDTVVPLMFWAAPGSTAVVENFRIRATSNDCSGIDLPVGISSIVSGSVEILGYHMFHVATQDEPFEVTSPSNQVVNFTLSNDGNQEDIFAVSLVDSTDWEFDGLIWDLPDNFSLMGGSSRQVEVVLNTRALDAGTYHVVFEVTNSEGVTDLAGVDVEVPTWAGAIRNQISSTIEENTVNEVVLWVGGSLLLFFCWFVYRLRVT